MGARRRLAAVACLAFGALGHGLRRTGQALDDGTRPATAAQEDSALLQAEAQKAQESMALFNRFDLNHDRQHNQTELGLYLKSIGQTAPVETIFTMRKADKNRDWALDLKEFSDCVLPSGVCDGVVGGKDSDMKLKAYLQEKEAEEKRSKKDLVENVIKTIRVNLPYQLEAPFNEYVNNAEMTVKKLKKMVKWIDEKPRTLEEWVQFLHEELPPDVSGALEKAFKPVADLFNKM